MVAEISENDISDEILKKAQAEIKELLSNKRLPKSERVQLEVQSYFLMFLVSDRKKINQMYPYVMEMKAQSGKWEPRVWDIAKGVVLLLAGALIAAKF